MTQCQAQTRNSSPWWIWEGPQAKGTWVRWKGGEVRHTSGRLLKLGEQELLVIGLPDEIIHKGLCVLSIYLADCGCGFLDELRTETWGIWEKHGQNSWVTGKEQPRIEWLQLRELKEDFQDWSILILQAGYRGRLLERCPMHTVGKEARTACLPHQRCEGHSTCVPTHQMRKRPREKK